MNLIIHENIDGRIYIRMFYSFFKEENYTPFILTIQKYINNPLLNNLMEIHI